ncbi:MAG: DUF1571 domain-containing protein [Gemmataceae bacterium]
MARNLFPAFCLLALFGCSTPRGGPPARDVAGLLRGATPPAAPGDAPRTLPSSNVPEAPRPAAALYIPGRSGLTEEGGIVPAALTFVDDKTPPVPPPAPPPSLAAPTPLPPGPSAEPALIPAPASKSPLRDLYEKAAKRYATMDTYIMRLRRREVVGGSPRPEEVMLAKIRKEPFSVYFKWLGTEGKGREVVYVKGKYGDLIHSLTATGDVLFLPGGKRFKVAPDSFLVKSKSRYPITEAGFGPLIDRFGRLVVALERGDAIEGTAKYLGELKRPEFDTKVIGVQQIVPAKSDPNLPEGGQRLWFFDPGLGLPVLIITHDKSGHEVEYYCHDRFIIPGHLSDDDFNPDLLWKSMP